jgi:hypothetical protein
MVEPVSERWDWVWPARRARVLIVREGTDQPSGAWLDHVVRFCPGALARSVSEDEPDLVVFAGAEEWVQARLRAAAAEDDGPPRGTVVVLSPWTSEGAANLLRQAADDVVPATIAGDELCARIHAILRRLRAAGDVEGVGVPVRMRRAERKLLEYLRASPGRIVTSKEILDQVFGGVRRSGTSLVRVHVSRLRRRLGPVAALRTIRGAGYVLEDRPRRAQAQPDDGEGHA